MSEAPLSAGATHWLSVAVEERTVVDLDDGRLVHVGQLTIEVRPEFIQSLLAEVVQALLARYADKLERKNAELKRRHTALEKLFAELIAKTAWLEEQFRLAQHRRFGDSSERTLHEQVSLLLDEAEVVVDPSALDLTLETVAVKRRKTKGKRDERLEDPPVERIESCLSEDDRQCPACEGTLHEMRTQVRRELVVIPPPPIPGSLASPSALAHIMAQTFVEGLCKRTSCTPTRRRCRCYTSRAEALSPNRTCGCTGPGGMDRRWSCSTISRHEPANIPKPS